MSSISSKLSNLTSLHRKHDSETSGEIYDPSPRHGIPSSQLRVSDALSEFLAEKKILKAGETVADLLDQSPIKVPAESIEKGHPLTEYFIDSSRGSSLDESQMVDISDSHRPDETVKLSASDLVRASPGDEQWTSPSLIAFWAAGAQVCAFDRQRYDSCFQVNEAMFAKSDGLVLKPAALRPGGSGSLDVGKQRRLILHEAGVSDLPSQAGEDLKPFISATSDHPFDGSKKQKTSKSTSPSPKDPVFHEKLEWVFDSNELTFLRILVKSKDDALVVAAIRLSYVVPGWHFLRMKDLAGRETDCTLLVKIEVNDVIKFKTKAMPGWGS